MRLTIHHQCQYQEKTCLYGVCLQIDKQKTYFTSLFFPCQVLYLKRLLIKSTLLLNKVLRGGTQTEPVQLPTQNYSAHIHRKIIKGQ